MKWSARSRDVARWAGVAVVMLVATVTRMWNLGRAPELVFDETYYVKDAWTLWNLGYESRWPDGADANWAAGIVTGWTTDPAFVAHPPLGKWLIALGMAIAGPESPVSWRISTAIAGIALVALTMVAAQLLFHSWTLTVMAGGVLAIDGTAIVLSRVALLDTQLAVFGMLGFIFVLLDRRWIRRRWVSWHEAHTGTVAVRDWGPVFWWRPWLLATAVALGAATAVKWSGLYILAVLGIVTVVSDAALAHRAGADSWLRVLLRQAPVNAMLLLPLATVVHLLAWTGWFVTEGGYGRDWIAEGGERWTSLLSWVPDSLQNWWHYQAAVYAFHTGLSTGHSYAAPAWQWPLLIRPTSMWYESGDGTAAEILALGNPLIWWAGTAALVALAALVVQRLVQRRPVASTALVLAGLAGSYLPWFLYPERTMFAFYAIALEPFLVIALGYWLLRLLYVPDSTRAERITGTVIVALFLASVTVLSAYFWPIWTGVELPEAELRARFWFRSWI